MNAEELRIIAGKNIVTEERNDLYEKILWPIFEKQAKKGIGSVTIDYVSSSGQIEGDMHQRVVVVEKMLDMLEYCLHVKGIKSKVSKRPRLAITFQWGVKYNKDADGN